MRRIILLAVIPSFLMSCSVFSPVKTEPAVTYTLNSLPSKQVMKAKHAETLLVNYPQANEIYNTNQMAYSTKPFQVAYFAKSQWANTPAQMLQPLIVQTLQNTHHFHQIISPGALGQYHYVLNTQLLELEQVFTRDSCRLRISMRAQIVNVNTNRIVAAKEFLIEEPAQPTPYGGVIAANRGVAKLLGQLTQFAVRAI